MQQPPIQFSHPNVSFYCNEIFYYAGMDIFKDNWNSPLEYVVSFFNPSLSQMAMPWGSFI